MTKPNPTIAMAYDFLRIGKGNVDYALYKLLQQFISDRETSAEPWGYNIEVGRGFNTDQCCKDYAEAIKAVTTVNTTANTDSSQTEGGKNVNVSTAPAEALRQQLIDHIHRPVAWAKVGKQDDIYLMDVEKTDHLAEDMANYAMQIVTAYAATVEREAVTKAVKHLVDHYKANNSHGYGDSGEWLGDAEEYLEELQSNENT